MAACNSGPGAPDSGADDEIITILCERCIAVTAQWETPRKLVPSSVEEHVDLNHMPWNGVGAARPSGRPVWVEGEDWWVMEDDANRHG